MPIYAQEPTTYRQFAQRLQSAEATSSLYAAAPFGPGTLQTANPAVSGRMPAIGVFLASVLSGTVIEVLTQGSLSGAAYSGQFISGQPVYVLSGGLLGGTPPAASGDVIQRIGFADTNTSVQLVISPDYFRLGQ